MLRSVNTPLTDHGHTRECLHRLLEKLQVGTIGLRTIAGVAGKGGRDDIDTGINSALCIFKRSAVSHNQSLFFAKSCNGFGKTTTVKARATGRIQSDNIGPSHHACASVAKRRSDVDAFVAFLPQTNDGHIHAPLDCGNIRQTLAANCSGPTDFGSARDLRHGFGVPHGLSRVSLNGNNELPLQASNKRMHGFSYALRKNETAPSSGASPPREPMRIGVSATGFIALAAKPSRRPSHQISPERVIEPEIMTAAGSTQLTSEAVASPSAYAEREKQALASGSPASASSCSARPPSTSRASWRRGVAGFG